MDQYKNSKNTLKRENKRLIAGASNSNDNIKTNRKTTNLENKNEKKTRIGIFLATNW